MAAALDAFKTGGAGVMDVDLRDGIRQPSLPGGIRTIPIGMHSILSMPRSLLYLRPCIESLVAETVHDLDAGMFTRDALKLDLGEIPHQPPHLFCKTGKVLLSDAVASGDLADDKFRVRPYHDAAGGRRALMMAWYSATLLVVLPR